METANRTRSGVSTGFLAMIAWIAAMGGDILPFLVAGGLLFLEKDAWLKKQLVRVLALSVIFRVVNYLLVHHFLNFLPVNQNSGAIILIQVIKILLFLTEDAIFLVYGILAWKKAPSHPSLDHLADTIVQKEEENPSVEAPAVESAEPVCPKCGKGINQEMDFCVFCGTKLR